MKRFILVLFSSFNLFAENIYVHAYGRIIINIFDLCKFYALFRVIIN